MNLIGYGVLKNDKPFGIWPIPLSQAERVARREKAMIVPVYAGGEFKPSKEEPKVDAPASVA